MAPATKATQKRLNAAVAAFNARYADPQQWGEDRWHNTLYPALSRPTTYCAVLNRYAVSMEEGKQALSESEGGSLYKVKFPAFVAYQGDAMASSNDGEIIAYEREANTSHISVMTTINKPNATGPFPAPKPASPSNSLFTHWNMDAASVLAAQLLDIQPGNRVLDMCAAPGGKSVVLAQKLFPHLHKVPSSELPPPELLHRGSLVVNEIDTSRYKRLDSNLRSYLPAVLFPTPELPQGQVRVLNKDLSAKDATSLLPHGEGEYDKVLVDAPCSSERHIIHAYEKARLSGHVAEEMLNWKSSHVTTLARIQSGLLMNALKAVRTGGMVLYATCALGDEENDGVIEKVLENLKAEKKRAKRDGSMAEHWDVEFKLGAMSSRPQTADAVLEQMTESTKYGRVALPDHGGWGPLYISIMVKKHKAKKSRTKRSDALNPDTKPLVSVDEQDSKLTQQRLQDMNLSENTLDESNIPTTP